MKIETLTSQKYNVRPKEKYGYAIKSEMLTRTDAKGYMETETLYHYEKISEEEQR
jgi:hypothetical protein